MKLSPSEVSRRSSAQERLGPLGSTGCGWRGHHAGTALTSTHSTALDASERPVWTVDRAVGSHSGSGSLGGFGRDTPGRPLRARTCLSGGVKSRAPQASSDTALCGRPEGAAMGLSSPTQGLGMTVCARLASSAWVLPRLERLNSEGQPRRCCSLACCRHTSRFLGTEAGGRGPERREHGPGLAWAQECALPRGWWVSPGKGQDWSFTVCTRVVGGQGPHHLCYDHWPISGPHPRTTNTAGQRPHKDPNK